MKKLNILKGARELTTSELKLIKGGIEIVNCEYWCGGDVRDIPPICTCQETEETD